MFSPLHRNALQSTLTLGVLDDQPTPHTPSLHDNLNHDRLSLHTSLHADQDGIPSLRTWTSFELHAGTTFKLLGADGPTSPTSMHFGNWTEHAQYQCTWSCTFIGLFVKYLVHWEEPGKLSH